MVMLSSLQAAVICRVEVRELPKLSAPAFATIMAFYPKTKTGAIVLTNQGKAELDEILVEAYKLGLDL